MIKSIAIVTSGLEFDGNSLNTISLGGSESAVIYMAKNLAAIGNHVEVFCDCPNEGVYDNVHYYHHSSFTQAGRAQYDVCIVSRYTEFLFKRPIDAKMTILWCHDISTPYFKEALGIVDQVFLLSKYQQKVYTEQYDIEPSTIWLTTNGYDDTLTHHTKSFKARKDHYIYASRPERGLEHLLKHIWPSVLNINPRATLHLAGYTNNKTVDKQTQSLYTKIDWLKAQATNIIDHGTLTKKEYYSLLQDCAYMLYPTDFPEISCINAIEAQANNVLVITTSDFALTETVKTPTLINPPLNQKYTTEFITTLTHFQDENQWSLQTASAYNLITPYDWQNVAFQWDEKINELFKHRILNNRDRIIKNLIYNSDIVTANKLTNGQYNNLITKANSDNLNSSFVSFTNDETLYMSERAKELINIVKTLGNNLTIADLGSNDGILSLPLLQECNSQIYHLDAIDSSEAAINFLKDRWTQKYPQLNPVVDNVITHEPLMQYDVVICGEILEHIEHTNLFLKGLMKYGHKNTVFFFTVPKGPWESIIVNAAENHHIHHFEYDDIQEICKDANPTIKKTSNIVRGRRGEECSNYVFWFKGNNHTFHDININRKLMTRPYKSISVCMITKNEEDNLSRCLKTVLPIADEILITDTGSTDSTIEIARKFTNNIFSIKWEEDDGLGNFARARNESIKNAKGDYIFWIDADEQLEQSHQMFQFIQSGYYDSVVCKQKHCLPRDRYETDINPDPYPDRLFKNDGTLCFEGVIHEFVAKKGTWVKKALFQDAYWILHYGNTSLDLLKSKSLSRNPPLIAKNARLYPDSIMAKFYIMVDAWSKFVESRSPDLFYLAYGIWNEHFVGTKDKFAQFGAFDIIQKFYHYMATHNISLDDERIQMFSFTNDSATLEFYARESESKLFLQIKTT